MGNTRLSIIIPVYNVGNYLEECISSIITQINNDDEIILVEDKSTDNSLALCQQLADKHKQISIIPHTENRGLSEARNSGIKASKGTYITFIDSDDYIAPHTLETNIDIIQQDSTIDIIEYPVEVHHLSEQSYTYTPGSNHPQDFKQWLSRKGYLHSYAWNKIYRKKLFTDITFPPDRYVEDLFTIPYVMEKARSIYASNHGRYYYCKRKKSICTSANMKFYEDHIQASADFFNHVKRQNHLERPQLDILYTEMCNPQIIYLQHGGKQQILNNHSVKFTSLATTSPIGKTIKMSLNWLLGKHYCKFMAIIRNLLHMR